MKKLLLSLSILCSVKVFSISMEEIKNILYYNQSGLMKKEQYLKFINPYLQEASSQLKVVQYCLNHDDNFSHEYAKKLIIYIVQNFREIAFQGVSKDRQYDLRLRNDLTSKIELYQKEIDSTIDPQAELKKTVDLVNRVNEQYYKELGYMIRLFFWGQRLFNKVFYK